MKKLAIFFTVALVFFGFNSEAQAPWTHGALEVSANGHYIQHKDGTPFLWVGDTGWGMFQQLKREEIDLYLDNRKNWVLMSFKQ